MTAAVALLLAILIWASNSVVVVTIGSNQLFSYGLQRTTAGAAAAYSYHIPVLAAVFAWAFLGEPITSAVVVCGLIIASGVYLLNRT